MDTTRKPISTFKGLNNVSDPFRLTPDWFVQADNVDLSRTTGLQRAKGFVRRTTNTRITGAYATIDQTRVYVIDNGNLLQYDPGMATSKTLKTGLSLTLRTWFEEVNGVVYYTNGLDFGAIEPGGWRPWGITPPDAAPQLWFNNADGGLPYGMYHTVSTYVDDRGMESGNSDDVAQIIGKGQLDITDIPHKAGYTTNVYITMCNGTVLHLLGQDVGTSLSHNNELNLGRELPFWGADIPRGSLPCFFQGRIWVAEWYPQYDYTAIWCSLPLHYHHFSYDEFGITVPGEVRMMDRADDGTMIIGTDRQIWAYDGDKLAALAAYGVVDGYAGASLGDTLFFWTLRGLCSALPFRNLTEDKLYVAPGTNAGSVVMEKDGTRRFVVALRQGGQPYNRR